MTKNDQLDFMNELTDNVIEKIFNKIIDNKIPESWEGIELRWYLADKFQDCVFGEYTKMSKRKQEYKNTVLVENL
jgi:hypothetical protein